MEREVGGKFKREGTYMDLWLIHVGVWQKWIQYCKAIILQLKINLRNVAHEHTALTSPKNLLEMQTLQPQLKLLSQNLPFYKNIQVICMNIKIWEALARNTSLYLPLTEIFFINKGYHCSSF